MNTWLNEWAKLTQPSSGDFPPAFSAIGPSQVCIAERQFISFTSNDRLGLAAHPAVCEAAAQAARDYGVGLGSPYLAGHLAMHDELEEALAKFLGQSRAVVFNSGYLANVGVLPAIVDDEHPLVIDKMAHTCIQDGYHLSRARKARFAHNDVHDLNRILSEFPDQTALVVVDGVYSMSGAIAPLQALRECCTRYGAALMVDDAHGICSIGHGGRGTPDHLSTPVALHMGTFNKGLGSLGGFVAGDASVIEAIRSRARTYYFTAALTPPQTAAALEALRILQAEPQRLEKLRNNVQEVSTKLRGLNLQVGNSETPVLPLRVANQRAGVLVCERLWNKNIYVRSVAYPAVPRDAPIIRLAITAAHSDAQIDALIQAVSGIVNAMPELLVFK